MQSETGSTRGRRPANGQPRHVGEANGIASCGYRAWRTAGPWKRSDANGLEAVGVLIGRAKEAYALECVLAEIRAGLSGMLVLRGEAGIGKTALLDWAVGQAGDMQVARVTGVESEMSMGFAGLHLLLLPFLGGLERLPEPQREALESAFGLVAGSVPDRFLVGVAALTLITDAAVAAAGAVRGR